MNIGVVVDNDLNDDKRVLREIKILREAGYNVHALCFSFNGTTYNEINGINVSRIRISRRLKNILYFLLNFLPVYEWLWALKIKKFITSGNIGIIHAHDLYMARSTYLGIRKSGRRVKMILDLHENYPFAINTYNWTKGFFRSFITRPGKWQKKEAEYLGYADKIVVLSEDFMEEILKRYPALKKENFFALPNLPDVDQMNTYKVNPDIIPFKKTFPVLLYFGVVAERRGIFDALSAFEKVIISGYNLDFMIIGPVDKKDLPYFHKLISSDILIDRIIYIPWIDLSELPSYLHISDICIAPFQKNPQHESGVANKIYDYMLGGKPLIVSDCGPQSKLVRKYNCGMVFRDEKELIEAIIRLLENEELRKIMGENGNKAIIKDNHLGTITEKLLRLYDKLLKE